MGTSTSSGDWRLASFTVRVVLLDVKDLLAFRRFAKQGQFFPAGWLGWLFLPSKANLAAKLAIRLFAEQNQFPFGPGRAA